ncbi:NAD(P)-dependent oxidoreductase [Fructilactobacillus fructivorans]|uniref:NAD(P)-dependent oxidoreductase n=1 Tax=Fructilactobacillus fructivorans TaxID=1614 RepID=UPI00070ED065|nr:NAD(P)-dependent oxidoreductase [Fructilactobacillus fructivorans]KRN40900.1 D-lactate dehydrogenase [Fructilactobacillus fructivorans]
MFKITIYHADAMQKQYFEDYNQTSFELKFVKERLTMANVIQAQGSNGVLIDGMCNADAKIVDHLADYGVEYLFTRAVGINNIDVKEATAKGIKVANVPDYSPHSVAGLAFTLGMTLFRHVAQATANTHDADFRILPLYFSREIHDSTVGIIGAGRIGTAEAEMYDAVGANVLAYQRHPNPDNQAVKFVEMDELLAKSDIVSIHVPLTSGTEKLIGKPELDQMKNDAILVNTARGGVVDSNAVADAIENFQIGGYGTDVLLDEGEVIGKEFNSLDDVPSAEDKKLMKNYPNVIVTPHMGAFTEEANKDMVRISFENFKQVLATGKPLHPVN